MGIVWKDRQKTTANKVWVRILLQIDFASFSESLVSWEI